MTENRVENSALGLPFARNNLTALSEVVKSAVQMYLNSDIPCTCV